MSGAKPGSFVRGAVWVTLTEAARIVSPADKRLEVRAALQAAREALANAARVEGRARALLGSMALEKQFEAVAAAAAISSADRQHDLEDARRRVHAALGDPRLESALGAFTARDAEPPTDDRSFEALRDLVSRIELLIDNRTPREIRLGRVLWPALVVVAALCASWLVLKPRNVAAGKLVTASSRCHYLPSARYGQGPYARVVDGVTRENPFFGGCTGLEKNPWMLIDLGAPRTVSKFVVYGRSDCCWGDRELPLEIQISQDDREFTTVAQRTRPFTDEYPWRVDIADTTARYVRLYVPVSEPREILVNEVEVYGP